MPGKKAAWIGLFTALSVVGASLKIPAIAGSVALDAFPALIASVILGGGAGALIAGMGHFLSALLAGMPLGPFHLLIALEMAVLVWIFGSLYRAGKRRLAGLLFFFGNAFAAPLPFLFLMSAEFYLAIVPSLVIGSLLNVAIGLLLIPRISMIFEKMAARLE